VYITHDEYTAFFEPVEEKVFDFLSFEADRYIDKMTTGIDGIKKLKAAFPTKEEDAKAVKHCAAEVINLLHQPREAERSAFLSRGYEETENGLQGKVISSVSSGTESVSYALNASKTAIDQAVFDVSAKTKLINSTIKEYLSGIADANGVNLLYMGVYPCV
jgi:hypothetical protein